MTHTLGEPEQALPTYTDRRTRAAAPNIDRQKNQSSHSQRRSSAVWASLGLYLNRKGKQIMPLGGEGGRVGRAWASLL